VNNRENLRDNLLRADGIDPHRVSDRESNGFAQLLDRAMPDRSKWRYTMQSRVVKLAAAAVILMAVAIHFWGGSIEGVGVALADVLAQIEGFRPYRCRVTVEKAGKNTHAYTLERLSLSQRREIRPDGTITVFDLSIPKELLLDTEREQAHEHWLDMEPKTDFDLLAHANAMQQYAVEELGIETVEGHTVQGFHTASQFNDLTLWADVETQLPVRFRIIHVQADRTILLEQFEFDVPFDETLFSTTAPAGYTVKKTGKGYADVPHVGAGLPEEPLLTGLKVVAEFLDGVFPPAIELPKIQQTLRQYIQDNNLSDEEVQEEVQERLLPVSDYWTKAVWYINALRHSQRATDLQYVGAGVQLGDAQAAIMWWCLPDASTYRVIYGDLTIGDLTPGELPR